MVEDNGNGEVVHSEDRLIQALFESKIRLVSQRLDDFIRANERANEHVAKELDRRLHETNGFKEEMSKQVAHFMTRREAMSLITLISTIVSVVVGFVVVVLRQG